jgi:two-component system, chemotaxis family, protein-glutamate methylesterase/glutaminase
LKGGAFRAQESSANEQTFAVSNPDCHVPEIKQDTVYLVHPLSTVATDSPAHDRIAPSVIAIAASAGGIPAIGRLLSALPASLPAAVLIVQHLDPRGPTMLPEILARSSAMPVAVARQDDEIVSGRVYVAPPNHHLVVNAQRRIQLTDTPPLHHVRPSADAMFESLPAAHFGKVICVVLTGSGVDGAAGVVSVKKAGGTIIAQDRASSQHFGMPEASIKTGSVDLVLPLEDIPAILTDLVGEQ